MVLMVLETGKETAAACVVDQSGTRYSLVFLRWWVGLDPV